MNSNIPIGSRWLDKDTNRICVVIGPGPNSPWMRYEDESESEIWHCCIEDFFIWNRFERIS